jgi:hypothetical protein
MTSGALALLARQLRCFTKLPIKIKVQRIGQSPPAFAHGVRRVFVGIRRTVRLAVEDVIEKSNFNQVPGASGNPQKVHQVSALLRLP